MKNTEVLEKHEKREKQIENKQKSDAVLTIGGVKLTAEQMDILKEGGYIYLENMLKKDGTKVSGFLFFDDKMTKPFVSKENPKTVVKYDKYKMRLMDKMRIEAGFVTKAKVKWYGIGTFAYPYLRKENKSETEYKEAWSDPRVTKVEEAKKKITLSEKLKINRRRRM